VSRHRKDGDGLGLLGCWLFAAWVAAMNLTITSRLGLPHPYPAPLWELGTWVVSVGVLDLTLQAN
jgi:hypothetical protein